MPLPQPNGATTDELTRGCLALLDLDNLGPGARLEKQLYEMVLGRHDIHSIVCQASDFPKDFSDYRLTFWSSHACVDPLSWTNNSLVFGSQVYDVARILSEWKFKHNYLSVLLACETSTDLTTASPLDEYFGLDSALRIVGCQHVVSTMWNLTDVTAPFFGSLLLQGPFMRKSVAQIMKTIRIHTFNGTWRSILRSAFARRGEEGALRKRACQEAFDQIDALTEEAFTRISFWGVLRNLE
jgi:hypothetical protein